MTGSKKRKWGNNKTNFGCLFLLRTTSNHSKLTLLQVYSLYFF